MALEYLGATHDQFWFEEARRRARNGIALLDEFQRAGEWRKHINIPALDMGHPARDVLGQLFGSYNRGMEALFGEDWAERPSQSDLRTGKPFVAFGFAEHMGMTRFLLTDAWKKELWSQ